MSVVPLKRPDSLATLAAQANTAHHDGIDRFIEAGRALIAAKGQLEHGEWLPWIEKNLDFSVATAQRYMRIAAADDPEAQIEKEFLKYSSTPEHLPSEPPPGGGKVVNESLEDDDKPLGAPTKKQRFLALGALDLIEQMSDETWRAVQSSVAARRWQPQKVKDEEIAARIAIDFLKMEDREARAHVREELFVLACDEYAPVIDFLKAKLAELEGSACSIPPTGEAS